MSYGGCRVLKKLRLLNRGQLREPFLYRLADLASGITEGSTLKGSLKFLPVITFLRSTGVQGDRKRRTNLGSSSSLDAQFDKSGLGNVRTCVHCQSASG